MSKEIRFCGSVDEAPSLPGAYVIAIELAETIVVTLCGRAAMDLPAGRYLYCGSAKGPGGLKARLSRHMRRGKAMHWHIDQLTERGSVVGSWISPGGDECELVRRFTQLPIPIPGFGSSDCGKCRSHLLQWSNRTALPLLDAGISARRGGVRYACHRTEAPESVMVLTPRALEVRFSPSPRAGAHAEHLMERT